jgi:hypothetical protein
MRPEARLARAARRPGRDTEDREYESMGTGRRSRILSAAALAALLLAPSAAFASKSDALQITKNIRATHMPFGTIIDPTFDSPTGTTIVHYTRGGDSALWTGHYLAAESYRFATTGKKKALGNVRAALDGIRSLVDVTGRDVLARCRMPVAWEDTADAKAIVTEEAGHGVYRGTIDGEANYWIGDTSRDQYSGVFFGLGVVYDLVPEAKDPAVRPIVRDLVTRLLDDLLAHDWAVVMPDGRVSTVFVGRFDQQLAFLQLGRVVNPGRFAALYRDFRSRNAALVAGPLAIDGVDDHDSYFKFNLDYVNMYTLIHFEEEGVGRRIYLDAYHVLRDRTVTHRNAHFNMIDRAVRGADDPRDRETVDLLEAWLERPRRDGWVDLRGSVAACGDDRACDPIPVEDQVRTDFLWQRSPFLLYGGGVGTIEGAGIDYLLPYWMARYYGIPA